MLKSTFVKSIGVVGESTGVLHCERIGTSDLYLLTYKVLMYENVRAECLSKDLKLYRVVVDRKALPQSNALRHLDLQISLCTYTILFLCHIKWRLLLHHCNNCNLNHSSIPINVKRQAKQIRSVACCSRNADFQIHSPLISKRTRYLRKCHAILDFALIANFLRKQHNKAATTKGEKCRLYLCTIIEPNAPQLQWSAQIDKRTSWETHWQPYKFTDTQPPSTEHRYEQRRSSRRSRPTLLLLLLW